MSDARPDGSHAGASVAGAGTRVSRWRSAVVHGGLLAFALAILVRSAQVQLVDATRWQELATTQQEKTESVVPQRGAILDVTGAPLVETRDQIRLAFTPRNLYTAKVRKSRRDKARGDSAMLAPPVVVRRELTRLRVPDSLIRRVLDSTRRWVVLPGLFLPSDVQRLMSLPGVTPTRQFKRIVSASPGVRALLGTLSADEVPSGGIEQELDSLLRGARGQTIMITDGRGNVVETPARDRVLARAGHTVTLTINQALQEVAERELAKGLEETGASGGDVVIVDPRDGAVLAMAGMRDRQPALSATALSQPYEPGSVMKPFIVARALELQRVTADDRINTEGGKWTVAKRTITDEHTAATMSVRDVIRLSSNIGAVKIAQRMSEREEYESLRDAGFGTPTGVPYPAESRGRLPVPSWQPQTSASVAMGYEMSATALQIAMGYAAIANDGELLQAHLVRTVTDPERRVVYGQRREVVRRLMQPATARLMRTILASVVDSGTAVAADLATYDVAGKSGTARRAEGGRYDGRSYNSTFAGMFPAQSPQYVLVVRLVDPQGKIFGGTVAGRVVNNILQSALAMRNAGLDRGGLAAVAKPLPAAPVRPLSASAVAAARRDTARFDSVRAPMLPPALPVAAPSRVIVALPFARPVTARPDAERLVARPVPSVVGLDLRQATRTLHAAGFHVTVVPGDAGRTRPAAGTLALPGTLIALEMAK